MDPSISPNDRSARDKIKSAISKLNYGSEDDGTSILNLETGSVLISDEVNRHFEEEKHSPVDEPHRLPDVDPETDKKPRRKKSTKMIGSGEDDIYVIYF